MTDFVGSTQVTDVQPAVAEAASASPADAELIRAYFRRVAPEDQPRRAADIAAMVAAHRELAGRRRAGEVLVRAYNPASGGDGWGRSSTVVDVVNDDMPYLVDSVVSELTAAGITVHRVLHPILIVRRGHDDGDLKKIVGESTPGLDRDGALAESWMHLLVDRLTDADRLAALETSVGAALSYTRQVVADTPAMTAQARQTAAEVRAGVTSSPGGHGSDGGAMGAAEAADLLDWMAAGNVTFLGYRRTGQPSGTSGSPSSAGTTPMDLGLWADAIDDPSLADQPPEPADGDIVGVRQQWLDTAVSRDRPSLSIAATVRGPVGAPVRHEFLVGLTESARNGDITGIPVLRRTVQHVLDRLGAARQSYSGQRAMEVLATYPRAELFWADLSHVTEVVAGQLQLASRRRLRVFLQPDPRGRFISALVYLPRDRYTTARRLAMQ
jgi:glutamate dehydrogenase